MSARHETPSQTVGPYFTMSLFAEGQNHLAGGAVPGQRIRIEGRVLDGDRARIEDALIEIWQANADGRYDHPADQRDDIALTAGFTGYGRTASGFTDGTFVFDTIKPGRVPDGQGGWQAPHLNVIIQSRGMLLPSFTRCYFADEAEANAQDAVLRLVPAERRSTIVAEAVGVDGGVATYRFDIRFQGADETVFFDV